MDGFEGHGNFLFRNTGSFLASDLIREAVGLTAVVWGVAPFITYVAVGKVRSTNPGYCYILAGFKRVGYGHSQKHGKMARLEMDESEVRRCWLEEVLR